MINKREETELIATLRKVYPYLSIFLLCSTLVFVYLRTIWIDKNYPSITVIETDFSGRIVKFPPSLSYGGRLLVNLNSGINFSLGSKVLIHNYTYEIPSLRHFLQIGDSINSSKSKNIGRQIYVYRDGKEYYFILNKTVNQ